MKKTILTTIASLMLTGIGQARTWTSADGSKTFEGDLVSCDDNSVTVRRGIKQMTFKLALLSEEDQKWAKEEGAKITAAEENKEEAAQFMDGDFGKALKKLQKLDGEAFVDYELEDAPKYFLLYFSASW
ncbi:hypothetical protein OAP08_00725 [Akkermansiaceae bacterium]|nr:hypothetical protein [bacterium]MDA7498290.1 hypothetical protein [Akkermansiaceae bacterium]MDA7612777.1 hypothetical protein [Akkermansiaceae bacterium]MDA7623860.1 hypothetical protein [Akkermansiaceae bacterium]MDA7626749.1 hypothetical protein [Akkermansiaceae bacterium]